MTKMDIVRDYVERYIASVDSGVKCNKTELARKIYSENKDIFNNVELIRTYIRKLFHLTSIHSKKDIHFLKYRNTFSKSKNTTLKLDLSTNSASAIKRLFFDIETTPIIAYTWRIGYNISLPFENIIEDWKIICISYKWENENEVHNLRWDNGDDKQLLIDFLKVAKLADEMIAHNGDRFDIKKIRTRCIYHRIPMFPKYRTLDTLKKSRGNFAFNSNKLDYIAQYLNVGKKQEHEGFDLWIKCMKGDEQAIFDMVSYCNQDVIILEDVYHALQHYIKPNTHAGVINGEYKYSCPICAEKEIELVKSDVTQKGTISRVVKCTSCEHVYNISNIAFMQYLNKDIGNVT